MKHIRKALPQDADAITELRIREFSRSADFKLLKPEALQWGPVDEAQTVIGVWNGRNQAIATMRMVRVDDADQATDILECALPPVLNYPGLVFNAAATLADYRRQGFNQLLRYYCIRYARSMGIRSLLSPVYQSAPRIGFMKQLGYVCHDLSDSWQTKLKPNSPRILCVLDSGRFDAALALIETTVPELIRDYPWQGDALD
ncbi:MAG TPA: hypothetical protein DHV36_16885 [Desulfobacteraceae bacterium]|nr:hypothetical protein [Desulfobacteraceae bacterium]